MSIGDGFLLEIIFGVCILLESTDAFGRFQTIYTEGISYYIAVCHRCRSIVSRPCAAIQSTESLILDGVYEMMTENQFVAWAALAINGGVPAGDATTEWKTAYGAHDAVRDSLGRSATDRNRCAMKVADRVHIRDTQSRAQRYDMKGHPHNFRATASSADLGFCFFFRL